MEVSLCAQVMTSTPSAGSTAGAVPGSASVITGSARNGAPFVTVANLEENSPKVRCCARSRTRPNAAASQKHVLPPLPRATS